MVGISIAAAISTPYIRTHLLEVLPAEKAMLLLEKTEIIRQLDPSTLQGVRTIFADGYSLQIKMLIGFSAAQLLTTALMWTNKIAQPPGQHD